MKKETKEWFEKSKDDLNTANYNFDGGKYEVAAFFCQQAVEKALKALQIEQSNKFDKTHDLFFLSKKVSLPEDLQNKCKELSPAYTYTRYPDLPIIKNIEERAKELLAYAEEVLDWIKNKI